MQSISAGAGAAGHLSQRRTPNHGRSLLLPMTRNSSATGGTRDRSGCALYWRVTGAKKYMQVHKPLLNALRKTQRTKPSVTSASSWGRHGYSAVWLDPSEQLDIPAPEKSSGDYVTAEQSAMPGLPGPTGTRIEQSLRELLLAQASDWPS